MNVLFSRETIARRIREMGEELTLFYRNKPLTCIALLNGAVPFAADLIRAMDLPLQFDTLALSSYSGHCSNGVLQFRSRIKLPVAGRHVLILEDILDSGVTGQEIRKLFQEQALSVRFCVMLEKDVPRRPEALQHADFAGFHIADLFVAGYGMDDDEKYRNLPDIVCIGSGHGSPVTV